jgi:hypothetical protein
MLPRGTNSFLLHQVQHQQAEAGPSRAAAAAAAAAAMDLNARTHGRASWGLGFTGPFAGLPEAIAIIIIALASLSLCDRTAQQSYSYRAKYMCVPVTCVTMSRQPRRITVASSSFFAARLLLYWRSTKKLA